MKKKTDTKKPYKSLLSNAAWSFRRLMKYAPSSFFMLVLCVPLTVALATWLLVRRSTSAAVTPAAESTSDAANRIL